MLILLLVAKPLFILLYSDRWISSVPYFQILCLAGLALCLQSVNNQAIAAIGKSKQMFWWTVVKRSFTLLVKIVGLIYWGMEGLLVGIVLSFWFAYLVNISLVSKYIGYKSLQQLRDLLPTLLVSVFALSVSYAATYFFDLNLYVDGLLKLIVFVLIYGGWSVLFKPQEYKYFKSILVPLILKVRCTAFEH
jgi:O-antigen/teichoic acid export membrane protein